jgi:hypothetical protein
MTNLGRLNKFPGYNADYVEHRPEYQIAFLVLIRAQDTIYLRDVEYFTYNSKSYVFTPRKRGVQSFSKEVAASGFPLSSVRKKMGGASFRGTGSVRES